MQRWFDIKEDPIKRKSRGATSDWMCASGKATEGLVIIVFLSMESVLDLDKFVRGLVHEDREIAIRRR